MKKSGRLYVWVLAVWGFCALLLLLYLWRECREAERGVVCGLLAVSVAILILFWLGSVKDFLFSLCHAVKKNTFREAYRQVENYVADTEPRFILLYCTANDFNPNALATSMAQEYGNFSTYVLDDSKDPQIKANIDEFAKTHAVSVVRREGREGFKAGNLNHFLRNYQDYDYFVVLDSDEILPPDYLFEVNKYFGALPHAGAVQARHVASKGENVFQSLLGMSVKSNGRTAQEVKNFYGANALLGHGMAVSRECYLATGGFPHVVAEDISFAVLIKNAGYEIVYAPNIECVEEFPTNYVSLKKRQCKWTQGNLEYMQRYHGDIMGSNMTWFEKLDMILSHYMLPITPVLSFLLVVVNILLGLFDYAVVRHSIFIYAVMTLFLLSPLIPDLFVYGHTQKAYRLLPYFALNIVTYASMAPMMLRTVWRGIWSKRATFIVTPKGKTRFSLYDMLAHTIDSLLFAFGIGVFSIWSCGTVIPAILLVGSCALAPVAVGLSNITFSDKRRDAPKEASV